MSYTPSLGQISGNLIYCRHLLISFDGAEVDHGRRLSFMGSMWDRQIDSRRQSVPTDKLG
jgi:hypothetical protein